MGDQVVAALAARPEAEASAALGRLAAASPTSAVAAGVLSERATAGCVESLAVLLDSGLHPCSGEAVVCGLLRIGADEAHERVLAHCLVAGDLYGWRVGALDVLAAVREGW
ncbi:hypothetical protein ABZS76_37865 [Streptomyces sp. NPDC005562]|uniref:hypothetical protein n=1 Tax=Streptomyces sp. NPDC005562 TaxID=3154890 RepID=UPI0033A39D2B